jgi:hypothetical protein
MATITSGLRFFSSARSFLRAESILGSSVAADAIPTTPKALVSCTTSTPASRRNLPPIPQSMASGRCVRSSRASCPPTRSPEASPAMIAPFKIPPSPVPGTQRLGVGESAGSLRPRRFGGRGVPSLSRAGVLATQGAFADPLDEGYEVVQLRVGVQLLGD